MEIPEVGTPNTFVSALHSFSRLESTDTNYAAKMTNIERKSYDLFIQAVEMPPPEWPSFLAANCDSDDLREKVQALLDAHLRSGDFLARTVVDTYPELALPFGGQVDEFRILRLLGKGGMGQVYLAEDTDLDRFVALKIAVSSSEATVCPEEAIERFRKEARAAARLAHPSVVQVYRTGERDGFSYIAMEYVEGTTLRKRIETEKSQARQKREDQYREVARLTSQVADALDHAHRSGVVHRDVKPSNVLLDSEGNARLADFGIARIITERTLHPRGSIVGSYAYMSPEQARVSTADVDHRTDIFSLGVVLYEAIALTRPFGGSTYADFMKALLDCDPTPLPRIVPSVPPDIAVVCHKALEKNVLDRYQSAAHFSADLRCAIEGRPILARPPTYGRRLCNWLTKHQRLAIVSLIGLLTVTLFATFLAYQSSARAQMGLLEVSAHHRDSVVTLSRFGDDLRLEPPVKLGRAPLSVYLLPGLYRVSIANLRHTIEATSLIDAGAADLVELNAPSNELVDSLVEIPEGDYRLGTLRSTYTLNTQRTRAISTFRIAATEVSNREYREYVLANNVPPPYVWPKPYDKAIDDLPVTGITWDEANLYCRWRGVRLPTPDEWEAACRGPKGSEFPWGDTARDDVLRQDSPSFGRAVYYEHVLPVASCPHLSTPLGIHHMASNVQEYTEGVAFDRNRGLIVKGRSWADSPYLKASDLLTLSSRNLRMMNRGFRIAVTQERGI